MRVFEVPLDEPVEMSFGAISVRRLCLVEVHAGGLVGRGETWVNHPGWAWVERVATLEEGVAPLVRDTDVTDPEGTFGRLAAALVPLGRQWGALGPIWQAVSGVDVALWDLAGQIAGRPVAALLGETHREAVPVYASGIGPSRVEILTERSLLAGFVAAKLKVGFGLRTDRLTVERARSVSGDSLRLFADANRAWSMSEAEEMCRLLADYGVEWCEEPLSEDTPERFDELFEATGMPLATGENVYGLSDTERYLGCAAVAHMQPDVSKTGGITHARNVSTLAERCGKAFSPHCYGSAVTVLASAHVAAASGALGWVELDIRDNPLRSDLLDAPLQVVGGMLTVPSVPGLGAQLDEGALHAFEVGSYELFGRSAGSRNRKD